MSGAGLKSVQLFGESRPAAAKEVRVKRAQEQMIDEDPSEIEVCAVRCVRGAKA